MGCSPTKHPRSSLSDSDSDSGSGDEDDYNPPSNHKDNDRKKQHDNKKDKPKHRSDEKSSANKSANKDGHKSNKEAPRSSRDKDRDRKDKEKQKKKDEDHSKSTPKGKSKEKDNKSKEKDNAKKPKKSFEEEQNNDNNKPPSLELELEPMQPVQPIKVTDAHHQKDHAPKDEFGEEEHGNKPGVPRSDAHDAPPQIMIIEGKKDGPPHDPESDNKKQKKAPVGITPKTAPTDNQQPVSEGEDSSIFPQAKAAQPYPPQEAPPDSAYVPAGSELFSLTPPSIPQAPPPSPPQAETPAQPIPTPPPPPPANIYKESPHTLKVDNNAPPLNIPLTDDYLAQLANTDLQDKLKEWAEEQLQQSKPQQQQQQQPAQKNGEKQPEAQKRPDGGGQAAQPAPQFEYFQQPQAGQNRPQTIAEERLKALHQEMVELKNLVTSNDTKELTEKIDQMLGLYKKLRASYAHLLAKLKRDERFRAQIKAQPHSAAAVKYNKLKSNYDSITSCIETLEGGSSKLLADVRHLKVPLKSPAPNPKQRESRLQFLNKFSAQVDQLMAKLKKMPHSPAPPPTSLSSVYKGSKQTRTSPAPSGGGKSKHQKQQANGSGKQAKQYMAPAEQLDFLTREITKLKSQATCPQDTRELIGKMGQILGLFKKLRASYAHQLNKLRDDHKEHFKAIEEARQGSAEVSKRYRTLKNNYEMIVTTIQHLSSELDKLLTEIKEDKLPIRSPAPPTPKQHQSRVQYLNKLSKQIEPLMASLERLPSSPSPSLSPSPTPKKAAKKVTKKAKSPPTFDETSGSKKTTTTSSSKGSAASSSGSSSAAEPKSQKPKKDGQDKPPKTKNSTTEHLDALSRELNEMKDLVGKDSPSDSKALLNKMEHIIELYRKLRAAYASVLSKMRKDPKMLEPGSSITLQYRKVKTNYDSINSSIGFFASDSDKVASEMKQQQQQEKASPTALKTNAKDRSARLKYLLKLLQELSQMKATLNELPPVYTSADKDKDDNPSNKSKAKKKEGGGENGGKNK